MRWRDGVWCVCSCCPTEWCPKAQWSGIKLRDSKAVVLKRTVDSELLSAVASCQVWPSFVTWPEEKRRRKTWADNLVPHYSTPGLQTLYYWPIEMSQLAHQVNCKLIKIHMFENCNSKVIFAILWAKLGYVCFESKHIWIFAPKINLISRCTFWQFSNTVHSW